MYNEITDFIQNKSIKVNDKFFFRQNEWKHIITFKRIINNPNVNYN